jgi:hypothetical protein
MMRIRQGSIVRGHCRRALGQVIALLLGIAVAMSAAAEHSDRQLVKVNAKKGMGYFHAPPLFDTSGMDYEAALEYQRAQWDALPGEPVVGKYGERWKRVTHVASTDNPMAAQRYVLFFQHRIEPLRTPPPRCSDVPYETYGRDGQYKVYADIRCEYAFGELQYELQVIEDYWAIRELCEDGVLYAYSAPMRRIDSRPFAHNRYALVSTMPFTEMRISPRGNDALSREIVERRHVVWHLDLADGVERWLVYVDAYSEGLDLLLVTNPGDKHKRKVEQARYLYPNC